MVILDQNSEDYNSLIKEGASPSPICDHKQPSTSKKDCCVQKWVKSQFKQFKHVCGGHRDGLFQDSPGSSTLWKKIPEGSNELAAYEKLSRDSKLRAFIPNYTGTRKDDDGNTYIGLYNVTRDFNKPTVIDIKMGTRTFQECEISKCQKRHDLYEKMVKVDPNEPTIQEQLDQAITKLRYMQFRERESSSATLGFRIDAIKFPDRENSNTYKTLKSRTEIMQLLHSNLPKPDHLRNSLLNRLQIVSNTLESSQLFQSHEVIGSSILVVFDETKVAVYMIDFAKFCSLPNAHLNHRSQWRCGNHEDGYLTGMDNLIEVIKEIKCLD